MEMLLQLVRPTEIAQLTTLLGKRECDGIHLITGLIAQFSAEIPQQERYVHDL